MSRRSLACRRPLGSPVRSLLHSTWSVFWPKRMVMSVDIPTVRRIATLARIALPDDEVAHLQGELNAILHFIEELDGVDIEGVEPMTSVTPTRMRLRADVVTDGDIADQIVANAPATDDHYFVVPKVIE